MTLKAVAQRILIVFVFVMTLHTTIIVCKASFNAFEPALRKFQAFTMSHRVTRPTKVVPAQRSPFEGYPRKGDPEPVADGIDIILTSLFLSVGIVIAFDFMTEKYVVCEVCLRELAKAISIAEEFIRDTRKEQGNRI